MRGAGVALDGVIPALRGTIGFSFDNTHRRPTGCSPYESISHCDPAQPGPIQAYGVRFTTRAPGRVAFEPIRHDVLGWKVPTCNLRHDTDDRLGNVESAIGRVSERRLLDPRVKRIVVVGDHVSTTPVARPGLSGTVERRVHWQVTLRRVRVFP